ncbi:hypothetical protein JTB14_001849 [Gonioctena quinquepunctata]|nr:hypothetical protein JTB14_001849 [Gonioctena quinquepunctata]
MDTRGAKRKSPSQIVVFEISDNDISPEDSDSDCNEPEAKIIKTESNFVSSVVNALSNLESEKDLEIKQKKQSEIEENAPEIIENELNDVPVENSVPSSTVQQKTEAEPCEDFEEGEVEENRIPVKTVVDSSEMLDTECLHITFSNKNMSDLYKFKFLRFVESFVELEVVSEDELSISLKRDPLFNSSEWIIVDEIMVSKNSKEEIEEEKLCSPLPVTPEKAKKKKKKKAKKEKDLFMLDTNPQNENEYNACAKYSSKFQIENNSDIEEEEVRVSSQVCFNCDGSHALKDCQLPKDFNKINQRRQRFKAQKQTS